MSKKLLTDTAAAILGGAGSAVRHPVRTASGVAGLVKGTVTFGIDLARDVHAGRTSAPDAAREAADVAREAADAARDRAGEGAAASARAAEQEVEDRLDDTEESTGQQAEEHDPRDDIPGPDVVAPAIPRAEDLPEPIVIEADDAGDAADAGEAFQHEPKAAGRVSEHEGLPGDREEAEGYVEEVVDTQAPDVDVVTPVGTTGADVGTNPDTAESDLQQPGTPPLNDPALLKSVRSEAETQRRDAERNPG